MKWRPADPPEHLSPPGAPVGGLGAAGHAVPHPVDAPQTSVADGWDLVGNVSGTVDPHSWIRSARGMWLAACTFTISSADGLRTLALRDQLVPGHALRRRG
jgi:hypothetical protein